MQDNPSPPSTTMTDNETYNTDCIECPECGHKQEDELYEYNEDSSEWECGDCGKKFQLNVYVSTSYTVKANCELQGEKHEWKFRHEHKARDSKVWNFYDCMKCGEDYCKEKSDPNQSPNE